MHSLPTIWSNIMYYPNQQFQFHVRTACILIQAWLWSTGEFAPINSLTFYENGILNIYWTHYFTCFFLWVFWGGKGWFNFLFIHIQAILTSISGSRLKLTRWGEAPSLVARLPGASQKKHQEMQVETPAQHGGFQDVMTFDDCMDGSNATYLPVITVATCCYISSS